MYPMKRMATGLVIVVAALFGLAGAQEPVSVYAVYATAIEEPWDGVIHTALQAAQTEGLITHEFVDDLGYAGDMERVMREVAEENAPDVIFGDADAFKALVKDAKTHFQQAAALDPRDEYASYYAIFMGENDAPPADRSWDSAAHPAGSGGTRPCTRSRSFSSISMDSPRRPINPDLLPAATNSTSTAAIATTATLMACRKTHDVSRENSASEMATNTTSTTTSQTNGRMYIVNPPMTSGTAYRPTGTATSGACRPSPPTATTWRGWPGRTTTR